MIFRKNFKTICALILAHILFGNVLAIEKAALTAEGMTGDSDEHKYNGGCAKLGIALSGDFSAQIEIFGGDLADELFMEYGLSVFKQNDNWLIGLNYNHKDFNVFTTDQFAFDWEKYQESLFTAAGIAGCDIRNLDDDRFFAGLMLRLYPHPDFMIESGMMYLQEIDESPDLAGVDIRLAMDYQPQIYGFKTFSIFYEERFDDMRIAGIRFYFGKSKSLVRRHREDNVLRIRG